MRPRAFGHETNEALQNKHMVAVILAGRTFDTLAKAKEHVQLEINKATVEQELPDEGNGSLYFLLLDLLRRHPYKAHLAERVRSFKISQSNQFAERTPVVILEDGSQDTFSYNKCLRKVPSSVPVAAEATLWEMLIESARASISPDISTYRKSRENLGDHVIPFASILQDFWYLKWKPVVQRSMFCKAAGHLKYQFADKQFEGEWVAFHKQRCQLQILCGPCNQGRQKFKYDRSMFGVHL